MAIGETIRTTIDPALIVKFHTLILSGIHPTAILDKDENWIDVEKDTNSQALTPDLAKKLESLKFITQYGWGQPVQSTQVDIDIRARLDQMGSGATNQAIEGRFNPESLMHLKRALGLAMQLPPPSDQSGAIDAEFTETTNDTNDENDEKPQTPKGVNGLVEENNPLPEPDSGDSDNQ